MKVIVKQSGFYGGEWRDASAKEVEMNDKIANQFLPPRGDQLSTHKASAAAAKRPAQASTAPAQKKDD